VSYNCNHPNTAVFTSQSHNHFEFCSCQSDTSQHEGDGSCWVPDLNSHKFQSDDDMKTAVKKWPQLQDMDIYRQGTGELFLRYDRCLNHGGDHV
jgi:hypothetical protein